jgi:hypothetical protein
MRNLLRIIFEFVDVAAPPLIFSPPMADENLLDDGSPSWVKQTSWKKIATAVAISLGTKQLKARHLLFP